MKCAGFWDEGFRLLVQGLRILVYVHGARV